ncbi:unnamed protein product [Sphenostylis stenocarpa]|uniref:Uncharacterized protein n=1 Tax=Sphenostylis stenocarpa TaxID=92480 RepID=A0AA86T789_9FABA|nr:unnamed protein product [Sphenostylis stenocarpa]
MAFVLPSSLAIWEIGNCLPLDRVFNHEASPQDAFIDKSQLVQSAPDGFEVIYKLPFFGLCSRIPIKPMRNGLLTTLDFYLMTSERFKP